LAHYVGVNPDQIIIGNGSDDLIELILKVFVQPGQEVLLPRPTFFVYDLASQLVGAKVVDVARTANFDLDLEDLTTKISDRSKLIFIANPNNPTANLVSLDRIKACLDQFPQGIVVVDECYFEFSGVTVVPWLQDYPNLIVVRSLSKSFGLAGLRIGYAIANPVVIDYLYRAGQIFVVNKLALAAGQAVLRHRPLLQPQIETILAQREILRQALTDMGCQVYESATNYLFINTEPLNITATALTAQLQEQGVLIANFGLKQGLKDYFIRVAIGTPEENQQFLKVFQQALGGISMETR
jgi:histidinol-phosphate aminotransferase